MQHSPPIAEPEQEEEAERERERVNKKTKINQFKKNNNNNKTEIRWERLSKSQELDNSINCLNRSGRFLSNTPMAVCKREIVHVCVISMRLLAHRFIIRKFSTMNKQSKLKQFTGAPKLSNGCNATLIAVIDRRQTTFQTIDSVTHRSGRE